MPELILNADGLPFIRQDPGAATPATSTAAASGEAVRVVLRFVIGDKTSPTRTIDLSEKMDAGGRVLLLDPQTQVGFVPRSGEEQILWTDDSYRHPWTGPRRIASRYGNAALEIAYVLYKENVDGRAAVQELQRVQDAISEVADLVRYYEEDGRGDPVYLEFRVGYGLENLPQPTIGQFSHFWRVKAVSPQWSDRYLSHNLKQGLIVGAQSIVTGSPVAEGTRQQVGRAYGPIEQVSQGLMLKGSSRNLFFNPDFYDDGVNSWSLNWAAQSSDLSYSQETRPAYTGKHNTGVRLVNGSGSPLWFGQSVTTGVAGTCHLSCTVCKPDGSAVTTDDVALYISSTVVECSVTQISAVKYRIWAAASGTAGAVFGIVVKDLKQIIASEMMLQPSGSPGLHYPYIDGESFGAEWVNPNAVPYSASITKISSTELWQTTLTDELSGVFSLSLWVTPLYDSSDPSASALIKIIEYGSNIEVSADLSQPALFIDMASTYSYTDFTTTPFTAFHLVLVQTTASLSVYIDGQLVYVVPEAGAFDADQILSLGEHNIFDALRIFPYVLSADDVATMYAGESSVKSDLKTVSPIPFKWIDDSDGYLNSYYYKDTSPLTETGDATNIAVVGGVPGDAEADTDYEITYTPNTQKSLHHVYLGRIADTDQVRPDDWLFMDLGGSGTAHTNAVGGEYAPYSAIDGTTLWFQGSFGEQAARRLRGRFLLLCGFNGDGPANWSAKPYFHYNASSTDDYYVYPAELISRDELAPDSTSRSNAAKAGQMFIKPPADFEPDAIYIGVKNEPRGTNGDAWDFADWFLLMPAPFAGIEIGLNDQAFTLEVESKLVLKAGQAFIAGTTTKREYRKHVLLGEIPSIRPGQYNYLVFCAFNAGNGLEPSDTYNVEVYVTPRKLLAGGVM